MLRDGFAVSPKLYEIYCDIVGNVIWLKNKRSISEVFNMESELILYTTEDGVTKVDVTFVDETVWLTQAQMAELFKKSKSTINEHIRKI